MYGLAYVEASSPLPGAAFSTDGEVRARTRMRALAPPAAAAATRAARALSRPRAPPPPPATSQLLLHQAAPLRQASYGGAYDTPLLGSQALGDAAALRADGLADLPALLAAYARRNLSTAFAPRSPVWTASPDAGGGGEFSLDVHVRVPPHQLLLYRRGGVWGGRGPRAAGSMPGRARVARTHTARRLRIACAPHPTPRSPSRPSLGAMLKWGWVQFLAAFAAVWWLARRFEAAVFAARVLETRVVVDTQPRAPKF